MENEAKIMKDVSHCRFVLLRHACRVWLVRGIPGQAPSMLPGLGHQTLCACTVRCS